MVRPVLLIVLVVVRIEPFYYRCIWTCSAEAFLKIRFLQCGTIDSHGECVTDAHYRELQRAIDTNVQLHHSTPPSVRSLEMLLRHSVDEHSAARCAFPRRIACDARGLLGG